MIIWDHGIIFGLRYFIGILRNSNFGNSVPSSNNYTEAKRGESHKRFPKIICRNLVFMDLINPFGISGDVT